MSGETIVISETITTNETNDNKETKDEICDSLFNTRLPVDILIDKFKGFIYGCIIGECYNNDTTGYKYLTEQFLMSMETVIESKFYEPYIFLKKLKAYNGTKDAYTQEVLNTFDTGQNARLNSLEHYLKNEEAKKEGKKYIRTDGNIALLRTIPLCLFYGFDDLSLISCMTTHANPVCLVASVLFGTLVRNILIGRHITYEDMLLCFKVSLMSAMKNVDHEEGDNNLTSFIPDDTYLDLNNLELSTDISYAYKTLGVGIYSLMRTTEQEVNKREHFSNILTEVYNKGGDTVANCCVAGSIIGGYIGYSNLPLENMPKFNEQDLLYIKNIIDIYLKVFGITTQ